jgi:hypothetical protein
MSLFKKLFGISLVEMIFGKKLTGAAQSEEEKDFETYTFVDHPEKLKGKHPKGNPYAFTRAEVFDSDINIKGKA